MEQTAPTAADIRRTLLLRADAFSKRHKVSLSRIGLEAVKDSKFLSEVKSGRNFTIGLYQTVMDWMDEAERAARPSRKGRAA